MFQAAQRIGHAIRQVHKLEGAALEAADVKFDVSFLFAGQIKGEKLRLFMIYGAGNFIECTVDTPYLQIGEHKYGKPVLDRAINYGVDLYDALKIGLISMDSTMRSNLGVGMPIDLLVVRRDTCEAELNYRIEPGEPYFHDLRERWSAALRAAHMNIPRPPYGRLVRAEAAEFTASLGIAVRIAAFRGSAPPLPGYPRQAFHKLCALWSRANQVSARGVARVAKRL